MASGRLISTLPRPVYAPMVSNQSMIESKKVSRHSSHLYYSSFGVSQRRDGHHEKGQGELVREHWSTSYPSLSIFIPKLTIVN